MRDSQIIKAARKRLTDPRIVDELMALPTDRLNQLAARASRKALQVDRDWVRGREVDYSPATVNNAVSLIEAILRDRWWVEKRKQAKNEQNAARRAAAKAAETRTPIAA